LLIFFMLTSSMVVPNALNLRMPGKSKTITNQPKYLPTEIKITRKGNYYLNGSKASLLGIEKAVRKTVRERGKFSLVVIPDDNVANERVVAILDIAYRYQIDAIMTDPK